MNCAGKPSLLMTLAYLRAASRANASVFAPVQTIFPELKMSAVVLGARMRMMAAAKRCEGGEMAVDISAGLRGEESRRVLAPFLGFLTFGLYSTLRA